jgi:hypothetical protein
MQVVIVGRPRNAVIRVDHGGFPPAVVSDHRDDAALPVLNGLPGIQLSSPH